MSRARDGFYLNKAEGKFFGVCAGLADYTGIDALWIRLVTVVLMLHGVGVLAYFAIAFLASPRPGYARDAIDYDAMDDETYLDRLRSRRDRRSRVRSEISDMDRRLAAMERDYSTNSRLSSEIDKLR